jgi:hypothetical protein
MRLWGFRFDEETQKWERGEAAASSGSVRQTTLGRGTPQRLEIENRQPQRMQSPQRSRGGGPQKTSASQRNAAIFATQPQTDEVSISGTRLSRSVTAGREQESTS